jgi:uncharacterized phage protein (TIGR02218 family)
MRSDISTPLLEHLRSGQLTTAICWVIAKRDGTFIRGTEHDQDIVITDTGEFTGSYRAGANITASTVQSGSDLAPDNLNVDGAIPQQPVDYIDVSVHDIEGGLLALAPVTVFAVNWQAPNDGQMVLRRGFLGEITRDSDGKYTTEIRGLMQLLSQVFVETYGERCVVKRFGDARCKVALGPYTRTGAVTSVTSRKQFATNLSITPYPDFRGGEFTFTSGANAGYKREVRTSAAGAFTFWEPWPDLPLVGATFSVIQDCNRSRTACKAYNNIENFRGYGVFIPGADALSRGPT